METKALLATVKAEAGDALEALRDLARGIYPPLLADQGLVTALEAQARKVPVPVEVRGEGVARYPQEIEAAVYFCCLEALRTWSNTPRATEVTIALSTSDGALTFSVADDGAGFDHRAVPTGSGLQNMADRRGSSGRIAAGDILCGAGTTVAEPCRSECWSRWHERAHHHKDSRGSHLA